MGHALTTLAGAGLSARINPANGNLEVKPPNKVTPESRKYINQYRAQILAELNAKNDSDALAISNSEPLHWLAIRGIYLEATGIWLQNISIQANSALPDDKVVAYISAHASEILNALVTIKLAELTNKPMQETTSVGI